MRLLIEGLAFCGNICFFMCVFSDLGSLSWGGNVVLLSLKVHLAHADTCSLSGVLRKECMLKHGMYQSEASLM